MTVPESKCAAPGCTAKASVHVNNQPLCGEHAWEATQKAKR